MTYLPNTLSESDHPNTAPRLTALILVFVTVVSCVAASPAKGITNDEGTTLVVGMIEPVDSMNPFIGINNNAYIFYSLIYDYLIAVDQDLKPKPNLATSWCIVQDELPIGSVWQYNLTRNAVWHDGQPFTADDVVFTMDYQTGTSFNLIWAYQPYTMRIASTEKVDEYTVRMHFKDFSDQPAPCIFGDSLMIPILPKHIWSYILASDAQNNYTNDRPIGTGPFMCPDGIKDEYATGSQLTLLKNPDYHGQTDYGQTIKYDRLVLKFYLDTNQMSTDLQDGTIDLAAMSPTSYTGLQNILEKEPSKVIDTYAGLTCVGDSTVIGVCMANISAEGTNSLRLDPAVRKAMAYATDREYVRNEIYSGHADLGYTIFSPMFPDWYWQPTPAEEYDYNLLKANQILDAAGYVWKDSTYTLRVAGPNNSFGALDEQGQPNPLSFGILVESEIPEDRQIAEYLTKEWAKIGIELRMLVVPSAAWSVIAYQGAYDLSVTYWSGDPDPNYLLYVESSYSLGSWSDNWYSNADYDKNYTESLLTDNYVDRRTHVENCEWLMYRDLPYIVLTYTYGCFAWRTDHFEGWGDWGAHPGRQLSNYWTANELFFDLAPLKYGGSDSSLLFIGIAGAAIAASVVVGAELLIRSRGKKKKTPPAA